LQNLFIKTFNDTRVYSFIWNNRPCWIAVEIAKMIGYKETSNMITSCINRELFMEGREYDVLKGTELRKFKSIVSEDISKSLKFAPKLIIFYEQGLYGFLQYTEKPIGITFRTWIRLEVIPQIRENGAYVMDDSYFKSEKVNIDVEVNKVNVSCDWDKVIKKERVNEVSRKNNIADKNLVEKIADNVIIFDKYLDGLSIADEDKFLFLVSLYKSASIDIDLGFINSNKLI
jgi:prophage antirepressor-like protein